MEKMDPRAVAFNATGRSMTPLKWKQALYLYLYLCMTPFKLKQALDCIFVFDIETHIGSSLLHIFLVCIYWLYIARYISPYSQQVKTKQIAYGAFLTHETGK